MHPIAFYVGTYPIHWYGVMMAFAFLAGIANIMWLGHREGKHIDLLSDLGCWIMVSGIVGARVAHVLSCWPEYARDPISMLYIHKGGLVYYGGFIGAAIGCALFAAFKRQAVWQIFDFACSGLPLAHAFGRLGCFLNGCCYGKLNNGPFSVRFPLDSPVGWDQFHAGLLSNVYVKDLMSRLRVGSLTDSDFAQGLATYLQAGKITPHEAMSLPVYAVQLMESGTEVILLYPLLLWLARRRKVKGVVACVYAMGYSVIRFLTEFLRGDPRLRAGGLTVAQDTSIALFVTGLVILIWLKTREDTRVYNFP